MGTLILVRHGESAWNAGDRFAGWVDVPLTERGRDQARACGALLEEARLRPDVVHTSLLRRAIVSADQALEAAGRSWIPVHRTWRLNERHYGALQGRAREEVRAQFGEAQFRLWRRSFAVAPPPIPPDSPFGQDAETRYLELGVPVPRTESLRDVLARLLPWWHSQLVPELRRDRIVLVVAHGNTLRALRKHLDTTPDEQIGELEVPTGIPVRYDFDHRFDDFGAMPVSTAQLIRPAVSAGRRR